jgi:hypothetical protein
MINVLSKKVKRIYNDFAMAVPFMIFAETAAAIEGQCGDKNRCNRWIGTGRRHCII